MSKLLNIAIAGAALALSVTFASATEGDLESIMWDLATTTEDLRNVEAFIENFPESEHLAAARALADDIRARERATSLEDTIFDTLGAVTYTSPLAFGDENIIGHTLENITELSPAYPPVEGLPEEYWKGQACKSCHQWTRDDLCNQAQTYVSKEPGKYRGKEHPFGGLLKINLRNWAQNGCQ